MRRRDRLPRPATVTRSSGRFRLVQRPGAGAADPAGWSRPPLPPPAACLACGADLSTLAHAEWCPGCRRALEREAVA